MDIEIPRDEKLKQKKKLVFKIALAAVAIIAICFIIILFTRSSIPYKSLATSTVDTGTLEVTISASGRIVPLYEEIIVSPINSRILEVYKNAGDTLIEGDPILKLELASVETDYNQKLDELEIRKSKLSKAKVSVANRISALKTQARIKEMQLKQLYTEFKNEYYVDSIGASTKDKVRQAELNHEVARLELEQLNELIDIERKNGDTDIDVQEIELRIFEKTLNESRRLLNDARILASQSGTLSFINNQIGAQVEAGTQLAILSDLSAFKVEGEIADTYAERMSIGSKATVKAGGVELEGTVVNITPSVKNGVIKFIVMLKDPGNKSLRSGLKTDVYVMQDIRENTLRVRTSSYYIGPGMYDLWVISGNQAEKRQVELGQSNYQYAEVVSGLLQGDEVIISDMKKHKDKSTIKINH
ncbi:efflux RND transporter periplasmic adaptor subunit [Chryseobacterium arthrosphaerae]|uniref:efflux RND transporter periplasmic adaptor subunit n=1 Tax=Chryseobacterium arthrosphaerae TaxID=651561 RepID=UPI0028A6A728|nr:HlyD family efflux transporter periplasmic adaptor subunit [Chryseobacterium arthrosphaerae]